MSKLIYSSRIPWLAACGGKRVDVFTGCLNGPEICAVRALDRCWAEGIAKEQCTQADSCTAEGDCCCMECGKYFDPVFHPEALEAIRRLRKPSTLAFGLGGDWLSPGIEQDHLVQFAEAVTEAEKAGHVFISLTKNPDRALGIDLQSEESFWFGVSVCRSLDIPRIITSTDHYLPFMPWVSFEPVLEEMDAGELFDALRFSQTSFVVIGGLSDGAGTIVSEADGGTTAAMVQPVILAAYQAGCRVFLKNLPARIIQDVIDPRTGKRFRSQADWREIPEQWIHAKEVSA